MRNTVFYFLVNARMPTEKAHGVQIAKMCEAFIEQGVNLVLVLPRRENLTGNSIREFYSLRVEIPTKTLWSAIDRHNGGPFWYYLTSISFRFSYFFYFLFCINKKNSVLYTVDIDNRSYSAMRFLRIPFFSEMHGGKKKNRMHEKLFSAMAGVIPTNTITKQELETTFRIPDDHVLVEPNSVDLLQFSPTSRDDARTFLEIDLHQKLVLYVGRFFEWKGLTILTQTAPLLPKDIALGIVGGTAEEFERVTGEKPPSLIRFFGSRPFAEIPTWISAADAVLVLGTKKDYQSYAYTSPMKVFEYMAMKRSIVASRTQALLDVLSDDTCFFYGPDNAQDLARAIVEALTSQPQAAARAEAARKAVARHTWAARAERIRAFINRSLTDRSV